MTRIRFDEMKDTIGMAFERAGMPGEKAEICAQIHTSRAATAFILTGLTECLVSLNTYTKGGWMFMPNLKLKNSWGQSKFTMGNLGRVY